MLQFLQTGKALYILAAVCGLGIISKLVTSSLYKRLIKETGNMALTKNKNLRALKQKTENAFLLNQGIRNSGAYIEKQLYGFRFMKLSLDVWDNISVQSMIACFLLGGIAAFGAYWYRCDSYYIVLYGTMGILSGLFLVLVDNGVNISLKRQQLTDTLVDYVENSPHFYKSSGNPQEMTESDRRFSGTASEQKERLRGLGRNRRGVENATEERSTGRKDGLCEAAAAESGRVSDVVRIETAVEDNRRQSEKKRGEKRIPLLMRKKGNRSLMDEHANQESGSMVQANITGSDVRGIEARGTDAEENCDAELVKSIDSLKRSLEQIAASREQSRRELQVVKSQGNEKMERARKELNEEDLKLLGELLQEYLK